VREDSGFGSNPGNLRMFSYVPGGLPSPAALVVVLHGCKQNAKDFARDAGWLALADDAKVALLLPEQKGLPSYYWDVYVPPWMVAWGGANNQNGCFNWFEPDNNARDKGEALSIRQMIDTMISRHSLDRSRVFIAGFSAGGAMTAAMLADYPELFAGGAIVAGVAYRCADDVIEALRCMNPGVNHSAAEWRRKVSAAEKFPPVAIWQGDADKRVVPDNQRELVEQWTALHGIPDAQGRTETSGTVTRTTYADTSGAVRVESVLIKGLDHAFPIATGSGAPCGQESDFVKAAGVCAAREIGRFFGVVNR
jgi:poly(hydroxyalkanoate) depolymerase family esterase